MEKLTQDESVRYQRQMVLQGWGEAGQIKLKNSTVLIVGAGGLGSPVSIYLTVAGVGEIRICDADTVGLSNLNRQVVHTDASIGELKVTSAARALRALNPNVNVVPISDFLDRDSVERIVGQPDVVVDCLDNVETRYTLNSYCINKGIPLVHGAVWGMLGQATFIQPPQTPCLRCLYPELPPKEIFPVLGATPGVIGCIQAMETLKYLTGVGTTLKGKLLVFDGEDMTFTPLKIEREPACPECGCLG
jgi:molybdopterin/thiamine biosynthesis adenylyltransferase